MRSAEPPHANLASDVTATPPLTLGTAGHIDHGKTALVLALTGTDTDRLPEEHRRGISIALGYASMSLPSGRRVSLIDVPGHERYVRTMVSGATGIDFFLMTIAADDGVMPQTREHAAVLRGLDVRHGVIAITKSDLREPEAALEEAAELMPGITAIAVSSRTGEGVEQLRAALDAVAAQLPSRSEAAGPPVLHVDRVFTIHGAGTVVTGTLWRGSIGRRDELRVEPAGRSVRVRSVEVHDEEVERAGAGQRVAVNLVGADRDEVTRGSVLTSREADLHATYILDVLLDQPVDPGIRLHVHHGTRETPARVAPLGGPYHQLRLEQPIIAGRGDRLLLRQVSPPDTLGGGVVLDPKVRKHGPSAALVAHLDALARGEMPESDQPARPAEPVREPEPAAIELSPAALALERQLREAGHQPPIDQELDPEALAALRSARLAVRVGRGLHFHADVLAALEERLRGLIESEGPITLARFRDELGTSRKFAQALLEHFDGERVTVRRPDDTRVLRRRARTDVS
jgi:selenocysteine-specific elongation factor